MGIRREEAGEEFKEGILKRGKGGGRSKYAIQVTPFSHVKVLDIQVFILLGGREIQFLHFIEKRVNAGKSEKQSHKEGKESNWPFSHCLCDQVWMDLELILKKSRPSVKRIL